MLQSMLVSCIELCFHVPGAQQTAEDVGGRRREIARGHWTGIARWTIDPRSLGAQQHSALRDGAVVFQPCAEGRQPNLYGVATKISYKKSIRYVWNWIKNNCSRKIHISDCKVQCLFSNYFVNTVTFYHLLSKFVAH